MACISGNGKWCADSLLIISEDELENLEMPLRHNIRQNMGPESSVINSSFTTVTGTSICV